MFCEQCGAEVKNEAAKFCASCGAKIPHVGASEGKEKSENSVKPETLSTSDGNTVSIERSEVVPRRLREDPNSLEYQLRMSERISTHRVAALFALLVANWLFGLISLIYSCKTSDLLAKRLYAEAESASRSTKTWIFVSWMCFLAMIVCIICYLILWYHEAENYDPLLWELETSIFSDLYY